MSHLKFLKLSISIKSYVDVLSSNLTIYILDNPIYHTMKNDPRKDFRDLYNDEKTVIFPLAEWNEKMRANQVTTAMRLVYQREITLKILNGEKPVKRQLDEVFILLPCAYFLRVNDVLSEGFNTYLGRMMDTGIVAKIYGKYFLTEGK